MRWTVLLALLFSGVIGGCSSKNPEPKPEEAKLGGPSPYSEPKKSELNVESASEVVDIPKYPNATEAAQGSGVSEQDASGQKKYAILLHTKDRMDKVAKFYQEQRGLQAYPDGENVKLMGRTPKGNDVIITLNPEEDNQGTTILVTAIVYPPKSNG